MLYYYYWCRCIVFSIWFPIYNQVEAMDPKAINDENCSTGNASDGSNSWCVCVCV